MRHIRNLLLPLLFSIACLPPLQAQQTIDWFPDFPILNLPGNWPQNTAPLPFEGDDNAVLAHFFPGSLDTAMAYVNEAGEIPELRLWSCTSCPRQRFKDVFYADGDTTYFEFPYDKNFTHLIGDDTFRSAQGELYRLLSFSTAADHPGTGRYSLGVLSNVVLRLIPGRFWQVMCFNLASDANGMWDNAQHPNRLVWSDNAGRALFLLQEHHPCGPVIEAYYPCFQSKTLFLYDGKAFYKVLSLPDTECHNFGISDARGSEWASELHVIPQKTGMPLIEWSMRGSIYTLDPTDFPSSLLPENVRTQIEKGIKKPFTYTQRFGFEHGQYTSVK